MKCETPPAGCSTTQTASSYCFCALYPSEGSRCRQVDFNPEIRPHCFLPLAYREFPISRVPKFGRRRRTSSWALRLRSLMLFVALTASPCTTLAADLFHSFSPTCSDMMCPMHRKANATEDSDMPCHKGEKPDSTPCSMKACCGTPDAALTPSGPETVLCALFEEPLLRTMALIVFPSLVKPIGPFLSPPFPPPRS